MCRVLSIVCVHIISCTFTTFNTIFVFLVHPSIGVTLFFVVFDLYRTNLTPRLVPSIIDWDTRNDEIGPNGHKHGW